MGAAASTMAIAGPLALGSPVGVGIAFALGVVYDAAVAGSPSPSNNIHGKAGPHMASDAAEFLVKSYNKLVQVCTDVIDRVRGLLCAAASAAATAFHAVKNAAARVWECLKNAAATVKRICVELARTVCGEKQAVQTACYMDEVSRCGAAGAVSCGGGIIMSKSSALVARSVEEATATAATAAEEMIRSLEIVRHVPGVMIPAEVMSDISVLAAGSALCLWV